MRYHRGRMPQNVRTRPEPLTDPAELWNLIGRFFLAQVLNFLLLLNLYQKNFGAAAMLGVASLIVHRMAIVLWKRLSRERQEKLAHQEAPTP